MTKKELLTKLMGIHSKYSFEQQSNESSQLCTMWSVNDLPDVLETTDPLEAICEIINMDIEEDYATELYDMTLEEAADSLHIFMASNINN